MYVHLLSPWCSQWRFHLRLNICFFYPILFSRWRVLEIPSSISLPFFLMTAILFGNRHYQPFDVRWGVTVWGKKTGWTVIYLPDWKEWWEIENLSSVRVVVSGFDGYSLHAGCQNEGFNGSFDRREWEKHKQWANKNLGSATLQLFSFAESY